MNLQQLYLRNFRNYRELELTFSPGLNILHGDNGQGKTNLLEAISLLSTGRSFRTQNLKEQIREKEPFFYLEATFEKEGVQHTLQLSFDGQAKRLQLDGNRYTTFQPLLGLAPSVLWTPFDLEFINGTPSDRRRFLNLHLAQSDLLYVHHLSRYWRAMKQRNTLLKSRSQEAIDCFEEEMALSAAYLFQARRQFIEAMRAPLSREPHLLSHPEEPYTLHLKPSFPEESSKYRDLLKKNRLKESELGFTFAGPHRDDLSLLIEGKEAKLFASEGQKKTATGALRFAEWEELKTRTHLKPLFGIDDLALHLDETRQHKLKERLTHFGQVFLTLPTLPPHWHPTATLFHISKGSCQVG